MINKYKNLGNGITELYVSRGREAIPVLINTNQLPLISKYPEWKAYKSNYGSPYTISSSVTEGNTKRIGLNRLIKGVEKKSLTVRFKNGQWTDFTDDNLVVVPSGHWQTGEEIPQNIVVEVTEREVKPLVPSNDISIKKDLMSGKIEFSFNGKNVLLSISEEEASKLALIFQQ